MLLRSLRVAPALLALALALAVRAAPAAAQAAPPHQDLPLVTVPPAAGARGPLVLILSGDGNWAEFVKRVAADAAAVGSPVIGLESRSYLRRPRTPEETATDLAEVVRSGLAASGRDEIVVIGYSRGAEIAPFVVARWPDELRARVRTLVLVGPGEWASFRFHWIDLVRSVHRPDDLPIRPELERLAGMSVLCVYGEDEDPGLCGLPIPDMRVRTHPGGHRVTGNDEEVSRMILTELGLTR